MRKLIFFTALLWLLPSVQAAEFEEGVHYIELAEQQPTQTGDKVEVRELFWYQCPHCYNLEVPLREWVKTMPDNAEFMVMPAVLGDSWQFHARVYYTLQALGVVDALHDRLFDAIHKKPRPLYRVMDPQQIAQWVQENGGPSAQEFMNAFDSFAVDSHTRNAVLMTGRYNINGVPTMVVGGKYVTTVTMAGNYDNFFKVIEYLIGLAANG